MKSEIEVAWRYHGTGKKGISRNIYRLQLLLRKHKVEWLKGKGYFPAKIVPQYG
jgi:hypothetical protein